MTKTIETQIQGRRALLVKVPEGARELKLFNDERPYISYFDVYTTPRVYLPKWNWQQPVDPFKLTEEEWRGIMPVYKNGYNELGFPIYNEDGSVNDEVNCAFVSALESGLSWLRSLGVIDNENWVLILGDK